MNKSFATYTPRPRPMEYDAIAGRDGCEPESGFDYYGLKAFDEMCVFPHDPTSKIFNQPPTVSYSFGPQTSGNATKPFLTGWAVWVATVGVRVGKTSYVVPPSNGLGSASTLYPNEKPSELTHSWNVNGDLAIAIQKDAETIELKINASTFSWLGRSPALFYSGHVVHGDPSDLGQLVCYYIKPTTSTTTLYARFEVEAWAIEHIIMPSIRVPIVRLINASSIESKLHLFAIDDRGRDVTLTTPLHPALFDKDKANILVEMVQSAIYVLAVDVGVLALDKAKITMSLPSGKVFSPLIDTDTTPTIEKMGLSVALVGGEITT